MRLSGAFLAVQSWCSSRLLLRIKVWDFLLLLLWLDIFDLQRNVPTLWEPRGKCPHFTCKLHRNRATRMARVGSRPTRKKNNRGFIYCRLRSYLVLGHLSGNTVHSQQDGERRHRQGEANEQMLGNFKSGTSSLALRCARDLSFKRLKFFARLQCEPSIWGQMKTAD